MDWHNIHEEQKALCKKYGVDWTPVHENMFIAVNESLWSKAQPINGLRHPKQTKIDGWYLWSGGEIPQNINDFFKPLCPDHLIEKKIEILKYLGFPPGWRFQIDDNGYEDVWFDSKLLIQQ